MHKYILVFMMHVTSPRNIDRPRSDKKNIYSENNDVVDQSVRKKKNIELICKVVDQLILFDPII
jgi:hypothetical protein